MKVLIDPGVCILGAFALLAVPLNWLAAWSAAVLLHEMGHILALRLLGGRVFRIKIGIGGAVIEGENMVPYKSVICSLAGPLLGALPVIGLRWFPRSAFCAGILTCYNLLPLYPLDGGRVLAALGEKSAVIHFAAIIMEIAAVVCLLLLSIQFRTLLPVIPVALYVREKFLANRRKKGYNSATIEMG